MQEQNREKNLKHVRIYHQLYGLIKQGVFPAGSRLPSEPVLAAQLNVSRMTLRRALALLQEDHLVKNIRGKGNYICAPVSSGSSIRLQDLFHPVHCCCTQDYDRVELAFRIEPPTQALTQSIGRNPAAVVIADRWYHAGGEVSAYSLSFVPIDTVSEYQMDLNDPDQLREFLEASAYQSAASGSYTLSCTTTGNFTSAKYTLSAGSSFILIQETLFDASRQVTVLSKHYIPAEFFELRQACSRQES